MRSKACCIQSDTESNIHYNISPGNTSDKLIKELKIGEVTLTEHIMVPKYNFHKRLQNHNTMMRVMETVHWSTDSSKEYLGVNQEFKLV